MSGEGENAELTSPNSEIGENIENEKGSHHFPTIIIVFLVFAAVSFLLNANVIHVVLHKLRRLARPVPLLVAHLAALSICLAVTSLLYTNDAVGLVPVPESMCRPVSYIKNVLSSAFSLNIFYIIYERLGPSRQHQNKILITRWIFIIWIIPLIFCLPTIGMIKPRPEFSEMDTKKDGESLGSCIPVQLFGSPSRTVLYELLGFGMFHGAVAIYMVYALLTIRAKLKRNSSAPNERLKQKILSLRLIYFHLISFTLISLPAGLYEFFRRVESRTKIFSYFGSADEDGDIPVENARIYIALAVFLYFTINPLISLFLLENNLLYTFHSFWCISIENENIECQSEYELVELTNQHRNLRDVWTQMRDTREFGSLQTLSSSHLSTVALASAIELEDEGESESKAAVGEPQAGPSTGIKKKEKVETREVKAESIERLEMREMRDPTWQSDWEYILQT